MQSKKHSLIEAVTNHILGLIVGFSVQLTLFPLLGIPVSFGQNVIIISVFFTVSIIRGYLVRRWFNKKMK